MPLLGWSHYSFEGVGTSCSIEWQDQSLNVISYNMAVFIFVMVVPFIGIIVSNVLFIIQLKKSNKNVTSILSYASLLRRLKNEKDLTFTSMIFTVMFILSWLPYSVVCFNQAFAFSKRIRPLLSTIASMFAKLSLIWVPLFYIILNRKIKHEVLKKFGHVEASFDSVTQAHGLNFRI